MKQVQKKEDVMNEVLKINYEAEQPTVSARELHEALGVASRFSRWFDSNKELFVDLMIRRCIWD